MNGNRRNLMGIGPNGSIFKRELGLKCAFIPFVFQDYLLSNSYFLGIPQNVIVYLSFLPSWNIAVTNN